jgi:CBS domain-containing protein
MNRRDDHLDSMLRHLGAAYYDSLQGRAAQSDVDRAVSTVAGQFGEEPPRRTAAHAPAAAAHHGHKPRHHGRWHSRVQDVMVTSVVTVDRITPYKEIARLLAEHRISGVPVLSMGRHVTGVVSEADLLAARDRNPEAGARWLRWLSGRKPHQGLIASQLMTSPALTIQPDGTLARAARLMNTHHVRRLPVVDGSGTLLGIVSRRDLLSVFLRPDPQIAHQVREVLADALPDGPSGVEVVVRDGVVTLTGAPDLSADGELIRGAIRPIWDVDGVVDVVNKIGPAAASAATAS